MTKKTLAGAYFCEPCPLREAVGQRPLGHGCGRNPRVSKDNEYRWQTYREQRIEGFAGPISQYFSACCFRGANSTGVMARAINLGDDVEVLSTELGGDQGALS